ncbi:hypothetical protein KY290_000575 [Solanum tuberosum]|uniref:Uncharacterized protein n=1 Tax=Solanum tuberosum TaxID=4113 RepID=A0ABQ7WLZ2_SOLTU|nr:hypothetical protein KY289_000638 [Solanum tuberosum]KAH0780977.1 hypothetical protein KY290_000575 [Solanum tuberosum]
MAEECSQVAIVDGQVDMQMKGNNLFPNLPASNTTANSTNNSHYKSHSIDLQSSHLNSHSISTNISLSVCNNAETPNPLEQKEIPTIYFSSSQPHSTKHKQLLQHSPTSCTTPYGGDNTASSPPPSNAILDRIWVERSSCLLYDGHKWGEHHDNHSKPQLLGPTYHRGNETVHGQLCEPSLDGKCVESTSVGCSTSSLPQHPPQWNLPQHFNPPVNMTPFPHLPFFTPQEVITANPLFFPWIPVPLQRHAQQVPSQASMETQQPHLWQPGSGMQEVGLRGSFTEISTLKHAALMIFPEREDKKYVHICPVTLVKCSFDLRPAVNTTFAKYAVVMTPTLLPIRSPDEDDPLIVNPPNHLHSNDQSH